MSDAQPGEMIDPVLDAVFSAMEKLAKERGFMFVAALARIDNAKHLTEPMIRIRCRGHTLDESEQSLSIMMECLDSLMVMRNEVYREVGESDRRRLPRILN
jgi:hypothetical protein